MTSSEDFIQRIEQLLQHLALSTSAFADKIGVQRSGISHLLSGRNKPSLDFVLKVITAFPEINLYWLMNGSGKMLLEENVGAAPAAIRPSDDLKSNSGVDDKIIIFHPDGTYSEYKPRR